MFTGIIESLGQVREMSRQGEGARLRVAAGDSLLAAMKAGDSIAVNGCCLTITDLEAEPGGRRVFGATLAQETLARTSLGRLQADDTVNLERPLRAGDLLSGHLVQGHVEGVGTLLALDAVDAAEGGGGWWLRLRVPAELLPYIVWKGSLTVEGISLTVARLKGDEVGIAIIPFTREHTNLRTLAPGTAINLETDPLGRHVERLLETRFAGWREQAATGKN